jgi:hypothetical protein
MRTFVYDIETYPNYILSVFKEFDGNDTDRFFSFTVDQITELKSFLDAGDITLVGYNNFNFDDPILASLIDGSLSTSNEIYDLACFLIENRDEDRARLNQLRYRDRSWICHDLLQVLGGPRAGGTLKQHQIRMGMNNVQDLPFKPGSDLTTDEQEKILRYCKNDVLATELLYKETLPKITVRKQVQTQYPYLKNTVFRRSDAAIAEAVMADELRRRSSFVKRDLVKPDKFYFDPACDIDSTICFQDDVNSKVFERLKSTPKFDASQWKDELSSQFRFIIGQHVIPLTQGGLHTIVLPRILKSEAILEFDASSYYPSILRKIGRHPEALLKTWISILNEMTDKRLAAKKCGNGTEADVYKIIINSVYGKLAEKHSINFDPNLQLSVVINGQLFLLTLMEAFNRSGFEVIVANTDGLYINAGKRIDEAINIAKKWSAETGFELDNKYSTIYVATSVNDYALFSPKSGWFHKKGKFGPGKRTAPTIITDAVLEQICGNTEIPGYIGASKNILEFLYSTSVKGDGVEVNQNGAQLQKTNRWYRSVNGHQMERVKFGPDGISSKTKIPDSANAVVVNSLRHFDIPEDIDMDFYIDESQILLSQLSDEAGNSQAKLPKLISDAITSQGEGFVVVPKGWRGNEKAGVPRTFEPETIDYWRNMPLDQAEWGNFEGHGTYTGKEFGIVGIDIDYLDTAAKTELFEHLKSGGVVVWHGTGNETEVRNGKLRGTILFKYKGDALRTTSGPYLKNYGFEILYGKKVAQLAGHHTSREKYHYQGKLTQIPKKLLNFLAWTIPEFESEINYDSDDSQSSGKVDILSQFQKLANNDDDYTSIGGKLEIKSHKKFGVCLRGRCFGYQHHSNKTSSPDMTVFVASGKLRASCFHNSCASALSNWVKEIENNVTTIKPIDIASAALAVSEDYQEVHQALKDTARHKLILAPTGSGKSYNIVTHIVDQLTPGHDSDQKFAIICSSKDQMKQFGDHFSEILNTDNINELGIDLIEAEGSLEVNRARSRKSVLPSTRVAITHYTYVSRRGFSKFYYSFLKFIDEKTHVFVDEIDAFIESQTSNYRLGSRWRQISNGLIVKKVNVRKCGMFYGSSNCINCEMRKYDGNWVSLDSFSNPTYGSRFEFRTTDQREELGHFDYEHLVVEKVIVGNTEIQMLQQHADSGEIEYSDNETPGNFETNFEDHIQAAYLPTVHRPIILLDDVKIDRETLIEKFKADEGDKFKIPSVEKSRVRFPNQACNVLTFALIDRRPLTKMKNAKSLTCLTATITPIYERFLSETAADLKKIIIKPDQRRKMNQIIVIGMERKIPVKKLVEGKWTFNKMLRFREKKVYAESDFTVLERSKIITILGYGKTRYLGSQEHLDDHQILLSYSFGSLGRGMNFSDYDLIDVNASIYRPISAYVTDDPEKINQLILDDRSNMITQNIGRILRRSDDQAIANKIVVIECLNSEDEFNCTVDQLQEMSIEPVCSWWVPDFLTVDEVCEWLSQICETSKLPQDRPIGVEYILRMATKLIEAGESKKAIKVKLRWPTLVNKIDSLTLRPIEIKIDEMLEKRSPDVRREKLRSPEKITIRREKRMKTISRLKNSRKTDGQIRSNMKVYDQKQKWEKSEQIWFEESLKNHELLKDASIG